MLRMGNGVTATCATLFLLACSDAGFEPGDDVAAAGASDQGAGLGTGRQDSTGGSATGGSGGDPGSSGGVPGTGGGGPGTGGSDPGTGGSDPGTGGSGPGTGGSGPGTGGSGPGTGGSPGENAQADPTMGGFAAVEKHGVKTTTGGAGGRVVTVTTFDELKAHAESSEVIVIQVSGTVSAPGVHALIKVQSNKTIIGLGSSGKLNKITLSVNSWDRDGESCDADDYGTFTPARNVVIRNLEFIGLDDFPDDTSVDPDGIRVECYSHHVWIDHNTFQYGADGATDVKRGGDMVTLSYNHYVRTNKTALIGHSDNNGAQDTGFLNVTFHHNFFDQTDTRTPRVRFGYAHVYNNYYNITNHVFRIGPGGRIYAEGNYVASDEGKILRDTENEGSLTWTSSNSWDKDAYGEVGGQLLDADQSVAKPSYSYSASPASSSPPQAGVGKL